VAVIGGDPASRAQAHEQKDKAGLLPKAAAAGKPGRLMVSRNRHEMAFYNHQTYVFCRNPPGIRTRAPTMTDTPRHTHRRSLVTALLGQFAAVIVVCFVVFGASLYQFIIQPTTSELASAEVAQAARAVTLRLRRDVGQIEQMLRTAADWGRGGMLQPGDVAGFNRLMRPLLENDPRLSTALLAMEDGSELMLLEQPGGKWSNRITAPAGRTERHRWLIWHGEGEPPTEERRRSSYDPRERPWFAGAIAAEADLQLHWTAPYQFFTTREPGITISTRWTGADGRRRVLGLDVLLADLSQITTSIPVGRRGGVVVITPEGELLGLPHYPRFADPNEIRRAVFTPVESLGIEFVAAGTAAWRAAGSPQRTVRFEAESLTWRAHFLPVQLAGQSLWIGAFAPDADFVPARARDLGIFVGLLAGVVLLGVIMATRFAHRVRQPLRALVDESERIGRLDLSPGAPISARWRELAVLVDSQQHTRELLASATARLTRARDELEDTVATRTAELGRKQAELADQLLFVQVLIDTVPNPIFYKGPDGRFLGCNQAYERTFGTTRAFLQGKTALDLDYLPAADRIAFHDEDMAVIAAAGNVQKELALPFADGRVHDTLYWVAGFRLTDGRPGGLLGILVDITETKNAERRARDAEAQLRHVLESSPIAVVVADPTGMPVFANAAACQLAGRTPAEFMRVPAEQRFGDPALRARLLAELHAGVPVRDREVALRHTSGALRWVLLTMEHGRLGNADVILSWAYDITPIKDAERERRKLSQAVEQSPVMVMITSPGGEVEYVNPHFTKVTGYTLADLAESLPEVYDAEGRATDVFATVWDVLKAGQVWQRECQSRKKGGEHFWVNIAVSGVVEAEGLISHCVWVLEDVSARKGTETALRRAKRMAEEAAQTKARFLANMSHEIRTPMNAIIGLSHLCLESGLDARQRDYVEKIRQAGNTLLKVINDVLDFSRIEAGRVEIESVDFALDEVLEHVVTLVGQAAQQKQLELLLDVSPELPPRLEGDPFRLGQVLTNLMGNAIKFTERGEVALSVRPLRREGGRIVLEFTVRDTGVGIAPEQLEHLFEAFAQADGSTTRKHGGTGLGLSICRHLVTLMGGEIRVDSRPAVGSTFRFSLAFGVHGEAAAPPLPRRFEGMRVLVVDDHPAAREVLCALLAALPFRAEAAASATEALEAIRAADARDPFGLVLMDWRMPGIDGLEATRRIKRDRQLRHPPTIVLVSAFGAGELAAEAARAGADAQVFKPLTASGLVDAVMQAYGLERAMQALPPPRGEPPTTLDGLRVLVVEDNEINRQIARALLESRGVEVHAVDDGQAAIDWLGAHPDGAVDAVLMDLQMPGVGGYEATRLLRMVSRFEKLPIIAMTAHALPDERERCLAAGMNDHVAKPIDPDHLFATLALWTRPVVAAAPAPDGDPLAGIEGLDVDAGLRRMGGDRALFERLLHQFAQHQGEVPAQLAALVAAGQLDEAERLAHTACGVAANIGAGPVASAASAVEAVLRRGDAATAPLSAFAQAMAALVDALRVAVPAPPGPDAPAEAALAPGQVRARLHELIERADGEASHFLARARAALVPLLGEDTVGALAEAIQIYDFEHARQLLHAAPGTSSQQGQDP
jgi:two-component system sensor histidine kinase/response regulator